MKKLANLLTFGLILVGGLSALQPLMGECVPRFDGPLHLYRLAYLEHAVRQGVLFPRWFPDMAFGMGFPLFNYYAPLSYYLALPLRLIGLSFESALLAGFALALGVLMGGSYLWGRDVFGREAGLAAAFMAAYAPFLLFDVYYRGGFAEIWGLAWLTLAGWAAQRSAIHGGGRAFLILALSTAAAILSHNVIALLGGVLLGGYVLVLIVIYRRRGWSAFASLLALLFGLGLSAFFWMPALWEQSYVQIYQIKIYDYHDHFVALRDLFRGPVPVDPAEVTPYVPVSIGWILPLLSGWGVLTTLREPAGPERWHRLVLGVAALGLLGMALPVSIPVWERISLLSFLQFPWRFLGPASLVLAVLAGGGLSRLPGVRGWALPGGLAVTILFSLMWTFPACSLPQPALTIPELVRLEVETGKLGTTTAGDYLPIWTREYPKPELLPLYETAVGPGYLIPRLDPASLPDGAAFETSRESFNRGEWIVDSPVPFRASWRWFYFPGWQATLDGTPVSVFPEDSRGSVALDIPAGHHTVAVWFGDTPLRQTANLISMGSWIGLLLVFAAFSQIPAPIGNSAVSIQRNPPPALSRGQILAFAGIGLAFFLAKGLYFDRVDNPFHPRNFDGQQVRGVDVPLQVRFGDSVVLMGYDLDSPVLPSDQAAGLTLYWRSLPSVKADYSVAVHWVDEQQRLYGQEDRQNPNGYPLTQLLENEFIRDSYSLRVFAGTPPGTYTVTVGLYDGRTGERLSVWDSDGRWMGTEYPIARLQITPPQTFPDPAQLPIAVRQTVDLGAQVRFLGSGAVPTTGRVGEPIPLTIFWQAAAAPERDVRARLSLVGMDGVPVAETVFSPGRADYPASQWRAGEVIRDEATLRVPANRLGQTTRPLTSGVYSLTLALVEPGNVPLAAPVALGTITVTAPERSFEVPAMGHALNAHWGEAATLLGYDFSAVALDAGAPLRVTLYWRADAPVSTAYKVFVHWVDPGQRIRAQQDLHPQAGLRPTTSWLPGEIIPDVYTLQLPADAPEGVYHICLGLYDSMNYQRLPIRDAQGRAVGDYQCLPVGIQVHVP